MQTSKRPGRTITLRLSLTPAEGATLEAWVRSTRCPYGLHKRARAVRLAAEGVPIAEIARRVDMGRHHVYKWLVRFQMYGCDGLLDQPRHGPALGRWQPPRRGDNDAC